jgi:RND family efflux transporter MFP subunit
MTNLHRLGVAASLALGLLACGRDATHTNAAVRVAAGTPVAVIDTVLPAAFEAAGTAEPLRASTLSTKLMGTVTAVEIREGDRVAEGQVLVRIDTRDIEARRAQVRAGLAEAEAVHRDAVTQAGRIRALYADSAATKAQLDQAETGLARAEAAVASARGMAAEVEATAGYGQVRAPFAGTVTRRHVDPGAFAAPGAPLVTVEDDARLRVRVSAGPEAVKGYRRGAQVNARIEGTEIPATIEGVVPAPGGNLYTVNAIVANADRRFLSGSAATLLLVQGSRPAILAPAAAVIREGDLTGMRVVSTGGEELRWIRVGRTVGDRVEVLSGLEAGDTVLVPEGAGR